MITSLLDNDYYALTMSAAIHLNGQAKLPVRYAFRNRTFAVPLATRIPLGYLRDVIEDVRTLRFRASEIDWLRAQKTFPESWLESLPNYRLPEVSIGNENGHLTAEYEGGWSQAVLWESILLALINEMYYGRFGTYYQEGTLRLKEKIDYLRERGTIRFAEFGTRRRFSKDWQHYVVHELVTEIPHLLVGTSNPSLAMELGLKPIGTMAHQMFMINTALHMASTLPTHQLAGDEIGQGIHTVLTQWSRAYRHHPELMTVLPDTYGTDAFIKRALPEDLVPYNAFRQDSGDPIYRTRQLFQYAAEIGKPLPLVVPSDSLDVRKMSVIQDSILDEGKPHLSFGWGTDLTNDLGYEPLSIVIKPSAVWTGNWVPCVKFSDDPVKRTGQPSAIDPYLKVLING